MARDRDDEWVRALLEQARRIAARRFRNPPDREDAVQAAVERVFALMQKQSEVLDNPRFIARVIKNLFVDIYRAEKRHREGLQRIETSGLHEDIQAVYRDDWELVSWEEVRRLAVSSGQLSDEDLRIADHWAAGGSFLELVDELQRSRATLFRRRRAVPERLRAALGAALAQPDKWEDDFAAIVIMRCLRAKA